MNANKCFDQQDEHSKLMKIINYRFPHQFKKIGIGCAVLLFCFLLGSKFFGSNSLLVKDICRTLMLLFLLIASMSKEAIEDEYVQHIRAQSYVISFVAAIGYSIGIPLIALVFDFFITKITDGGAMQFYEVSAFEVMFMLICFQLLFLETLKRFGRAE